MFLSLSFSVLHAQTAPTPEPPPVAKPETLPPPTGEVLFERHTDTEKPAAPAEQAEAPATAPEVTDAERTAVRVTAYDLDVRLTPSTSHLAVRARITVKNDRATPLTHIALQISSTLIWESATLLPAHTALPITQHLLDTDADHTGSARELILALPTPLAAGASTTLDTFYEGDVAANATRLTRIGATPARAAATDWDAITADSTALRGFGNVLWYPVASPALFLGDGAKLFQAIAAARLRDQTATVHLRMAVEYRGKPPVAAYFCGRRKELNGLADDAPAGRRELLNGLADDVDAPAAGRKELKALADGADAPTASGEGIASAEFAEEPIGFRLPSLFLLNHAETAMAPLADGEAKLLSVETEDDASLRLLADAALGIAPLLQQWFGPRPLSPLTVLDHTGEPFEDGPLVVAPVATLAASSSSEALAHSLTHSWVQTGQPWMDEGLAQFIALLWAEKQQGRSAMVAQLDDLTRPLALAEPAFTADQIAAGTPTGEPLITSADELYYRRKSAAVWLMLRGIVGDGTLAAALTAWRSQPVSSAPAAEQAVGLEHLLEKLSGKDLAWFFRDWVLHDRGLPDLSIVDVAPRTLPAGKGHDSGWLVAVTVHNDGAAEVEVPIVIRSGTFSTTKRLRVPAFGNVTDRVVVEAAPTQVLVNDGTTPETRTSLHVQDVVLNTAP